jgi:hypothetical protein
MSKEQFLRFRNLFVEERMCNPIMIHNTNGKAMDLLLGIVCLIMCKKMPSEVPVSATLHTKIKLVAPQNDPK